MKEDSSRLVSVVIPCHNAARWIEAAIASALAQSHQPVEVIVVDDASSDESARLAGGFGDAVRLLQGQWRNGNGARNAGLAAARGEWVQFLDADDVLLPDKIRADLAALAGGGDLAVSPLIVRESQADGTSTDTIIAYGSDLAADWLAWKFCQTGAALWRRDRLLQLGGWKDGLPCCQDNEVILRALMADYRVVRVGPAGAVYRIWSDDTVCRKNPSRVFEMRLQLMEQFIGWLEQRGQFTRLRREAAGQAFFEMARGRAVNDLPAAVRFHRQMRRRGLIHPAGPAAPARYALVYRWFGFRVAEQLARWQRKGGGSAA